MQKFVCAHSGCDSTICNMSSVFPMSPEGPQGTYCNSWGQIHDMITVTELDNELDVLTIGSPSTECCWFPGYDNLLLYNKYGYCIVLRLLIMLHCLQV